MTREQLIAKYPRASESFLRANSAGGARDGACMKKRRNKEPLTKQFILERIQKHPSTGCWIWQRSFNVVNGYAAIGTPDGRVTVGHRVVWRLWNGEIPKGMFVCHKCDVPACLNPEHLFLGTAKDNSQDCVRKGRHKHATFYGENHPNALLTNVQVREIRSSPISRAAASSHYGVSKSTIKAVRLRQNYASVD